MSREKAVFGACTRADTGKDKTYNNVLAQIAPNLVTMIPERILYGKDKSMLATDLLRSCGYSVAMIHNDVSWAHRGSQDASAALGCHERTESVLELARRQCGANCIRHVACARFVLSHFSL